MRYEYRDDDLRRPVDGLDQPVMLRTRLFAGLREVWDPFRFYVEFEDARRENSMFPRDDRDVNEYEVIQAVAELHFDDALGVERPLRVQGGRFAFEYIEAFYNRVRRHSSLGYVAPAEYERAHNPNHR